VLSCYVLFHHCNIGGLLEGMALVSNVPFVATENFLGSDAIEHRY
jgi:hypothetical protein